MRAATLPSYTLYITLLSVKSYVTLFADAHATDGYGFKRCDPLFKIRQAPLSSAAALVHGITIAQMLAITASDGMGRLCLLLGATL